MRLEQSHPGERHGARTKRWAKYRGGIGEKDGERLRDS